MDPLIPAAETLERAYQEFGTTRSRALEDVQTLAEWLQQQPHLPNIEDGSMFLENMFLRSKCSIERSKQAIDMYFTIKTALPEFFSNRDPTSQSIRDGLEYFKSTRLPQLTKEGYNVMIYKAIENMDMTKCVIADGIIEETLVYDRRLYQDLSLGDILIYDFTYLSMGLISRLTLPILKKLIVCILQCFHARLKGIHVFNSPSYVDIILKMVKPMLKSKLFARIHLHADLDSLHKHVDKSILPKEYGGDALPFDVLHEQLQQYLETHRDWFLALDTVGKADESKRLGKSFNSSELLGIEGSFKKLEVD